MEYLNKFIRENKIILASIFLIFLILLIPSIAQAQYNPDLGIWENITCSGADCQYCHFIQGINVVIAWFIYTGAILSAIGFAWAGSIYMTQGDSSGGREKAKAIFIKILTGFVILLASFLIVDLIMKSLLSEEFNSDFGPWNAIECVEQPTYNIPPKSGGPSTPPGDTPPSDFSETEQCTRNYLSQNGIDVKTNTCSYAGQSGCTSVAGMPKELIDNLKSLEDSCGCDITITGGTEGGHQTHGPGTGNVDLRISNDLALYITSNGKYSGTNSNGDKIYMVNGQRFVFEEDHWHVSFNLNDTSPYQCPN